MVTPDPPVTREAVYDVLRTIDDPEMPLSIVDLGIVDDVRIEGWHAQAKRGHVIRGDAGSGDADRIVPQGWHAQAQRGHVEPDEARAGETDRAVPQDARCTVEIDLLPTFVGCPALDLIERQIIEKVAAMPGVGQVKVKLLYDPPWTVDRISDAGRQSLREHGVTVPERGPLPRGARSVPPVVPLGTSRLVASTASPRAAAPAEPVPCPFCGSTNTQMDSPFGPTRCRMIYYCQACKNPFEHLKAI